MDDPFFFFSLFLLVSLSLFFFFDLALGSQHDIYVAGDTEQ